MLSVVKELFFRLSSELWFCYNITGNAQETDDIDLVVCQTMTY
jgi:hypothetical protein